MPTWRGSTVSGRARLLTTAHHPLSAVRSYSAAEARFRLRMWLVRTRPPRRCGVVMHSTSHTLRRTSHGGRNSNSHRNECVGNRSRAFERRVLGEAYDDDDGTRPLQKSHGNPNGK